MKKLNIRTLIVALLVISLLFVGGWLLSRPHSAEKDVHGHGHGESATEQGAEVETEKGIHGGRLLTQDNFAMELKIVEGDGIPPTLRLYSYQDEKPLDPQLVQATVSLTRLGKAAETVKFLPTADYLQGDLTVYEPHSFVVKIDADYAGKKYTFAYEQIEFRVQMTDAQLQKNAMTIEQVEGGILTQEVSLQGVVQFNAENTSAVLSNTAGMVQQVFVHEGEAVKKGQLLATLRSPALTKERTDLFVAQKRLAYAQTIYLREKKLWQDKITAKQDYLAAELALEEAQLQVQSLEQALAANGALAGKNGLNLFELRAPRSGLVLARHVNVGQLLQESSPAFEIADLSTVWVEAALYAADLARIKVGQTALVQGSTGESAGVVHSISAGIATASRTASARIVLPNLDGVWRAGLPVQVQVEVARLPVAVRIPKAALHTLNDWTVVFVRVGDNFEPRVVTLGKSDALYIEVIEGLAVGERIAVANSFMIKADIGKSSAAHDH